MKSTQANWRAHLALGIGALAAVAAASYAVVTLTSADATEMEPVASITHEFQQNHLHGLGYVPEVEGLYLATHYGLFLLRDGQLYQVGDSRDDYMGFSRHPHDPDVFLASGHPRTGGNLGVVISRDAGASWQQIFTGVDDETVDFHAMVVSPANPDRLYGVHRGRFYVGDIATDDWKTAAAEGVSVQGYCWGAPCLAVGPGEPGRVYAGTPEGIQVTDDGGETWQRLTAETGAVAGIAVHPENPDLLIAHTDALGVAVSEDGGQSWPVRQQGLVPGGDFLFDFAFDPTTPGRVFAASARGRVFESTDMGETWRLIMTPEGPS